MRARLALLVVVALLVCGGCYTALDAIPEDTVARADWFFDEAGFGYATLVLETDGCIALDPAATRFTFNGREADSVAPGGRGRDPISALTPDCNEPNANWDLTSPIEGDEVELVVEDASGARSAVFTVDQEVVSCDFPSCATFAVR